ncbi:RdlA protein [Streptomyces sp. Ru73]|uniref:rodlin n=1 Tax=Streptomyces sp. Ru73 TaxID=2080748 RepID=UPI000CDD44BA|nr:rodlin [Streptomyces sp. Ru73]POX41960.1 RdlA protein [Streptomyces sp. Ru73]
MFKKVLATGAVAASIVGMSAAAAPQALALGDDGGAKSASGNGASTSFGNQTTAGHMSTQLGLVQGTLNKPCVGLPLKANIGSLIGLIPITVQDINVLANPQNQQCSENSTQNKGDEPLSHIIDNIPVLSANGNGNG